MALRKAKRTKDIDSPFKFLADGLASDEEDIWEEEPVGIQEFIEGKQFLNQKWTVNPKTGKGIGCRPKIMEVAKELARSDIREAILLLGKGSGKDYISTIFHLYGIYRCLCMTSPQKYHGLSPGSAIYFVNTARNDSQAKNVFFKEFKGMLENCPWFEGKFDEPGAQAVNFIKNISALSANSQAFGWLGYNTIQWVGDELAFFLEKDADEESEARSEECWEAAYGSCQTRFPHHYKMIGITTPRYDDDFVMKKFHELKDREDCFVAQAATWEMNPNITIEDFQHAMARNYRRTMRDFGAQPMGVIESFWADPDFVENNVCEICRQCPIYQEREQRDNTASLYACQDYDDCKANPYIGNGKWRSWFYAKDDAEYYMHFDLSKNKDMVGFSIGHVIDWIDVELDTFEVMDDAKKRKIDYSDIDEDDKYASRPIIKIDCVGWISPASKRDPQMLRKGEIYYDAILKFVVKYLIDRGFNIVKVTSDQYQSHHFKQSIEDYGIETELLSLDRNDEVPVQAKNTLTENRVEYPYCYILAREAKFLKYINGRKIDHAKGESKDTWDAFAGVIYNCEINDSGQGSFVFLEYDADDY
jgi:hypothetical protein